MLGVIGMASVMLWPTTTATVANATPEVITTDVASEPPQALPPPEAPATQIDGVPSPAPVVEEPKKPKKPKKPKVATRDRKAKHVPDYPRDSNTGRRIVYDKALMTVYLVNKNDEVINVFPVVGRQDRPVAGDYKIYSKSPRSGNRESGVTFNDMVRFAYGNDKKTPIGFHDIPQYYNGNMMHGLDQLGLPIARGGCVRLAPEDARKIYRWSKIGDRVVVLPATL